jgi:hypothetical protein
MPTERLSMRRIRQVLQLPTKDFASTVPRPFANPRNGWLLVIPAAQEAEGWSALGTDYRCN